MSLHRDTEPPPLPEIARQSPSARLYLMIGAAVAAATSSYYCYRLFTDAPAPKVDGELAARRIFPLGQTMIKEPAKPFADRSTACRCNPWIVLSL